METAGDAQMLGAALNHSALNLANALGAWLGGLVIAAGLGYRAPSVVGAGLAVAGLRAAGRVGACAGGPGAAARRRRAGLGPPPDEPLEGASPPGTDPPHLQPGCNVAPCPPRAPERPLTPRPRVMRCRRPSARAGGSHA